MSIFTSTGVEAAYPQEIDYVKMAGLSYWYIKTMKPHTVALAGSPRGASQKLLDGASVGMRAAGCNIEYMGQCSHDEFIYHMGARHLDGGMYINAGGKVEVSFYRDDCCPLHPTNITEIREACKGPIPDGLPGHHHLEPVNARNHTARFLSKVLEPYGEWPPNPDRVFNVVVEAGDNWDLMSGLLDRLAMACHMNVYRLEDVLPGGDISVLHDLDSPARVVSMNDAMAKKGADLGIAFDQAARRIRIYGADRRQIHPSHVGAYLAACVGQRHAGEAMCCTHDYVFSMLNTTSHCKAPFAIGTGGVFGVKTMMRNATASYATDGSGLYFFRELWWSESGMLAAMLFLHMAYLTPVPVHEVIDGLRKGFPVSGPHWFEVPNALDAISALCKAFEHVCNIDIVDGEAALRSKEGADWRLVLRPGSETRLLVYAEGRATSETELQKVTDCVAVTLTTNCPVN